MQGNPEKAGDAGRLAVNGDDAASEDLFAVVATNRQCDSQA